MPETTADQLAPILSELVQAHRDHVEAARAAHLCAVVAGRHLLDLKRQLGAKQWAEWLNRCGIPKGTVGQYINAAQRHQDSERYGFAKSLKFGEG